jgi:GGDEF domain-containing protein
VPSELTLALRREFARAVRYRQPIAVLLVDLPASPDVLGKVRDGVRLCDSAASAPGNRVAVILPETQLSGALLVATRLAGALGPSPTTGGPQSLGVAAYPSPSIVDADGLVRAAETALEIARSRGGGIMTPQAR